MKLKLDKSALYAKTPILYVIAAILIFIIGISVITHNRAISLEEQILSAESDIQIQEKRRTDLIYNLVKCVKEYDKHEAEVMMEVVNSRKSDMNEVSDHISVIAEAYPNLKSNENYKELMNELAITENKISEYRNSYNNQIKAYNKYVRKFPHKQILRIMDYDVIEYKYLEYDSSDRESITNLFEE